MEEVVKQGLFQNKTRSLEDWKAQYVLHKHQWEFETETVDTQVWKP